MSRNRVESALSSIKSVADRLQSLHNASHEVTDISITLGSEISAATSAFESLMREIEQEIADLKAQVSDAGWQLEAAARESRDRDNSTWK